MKITFLGATKTVTGSNFLVEACGKRFLVDCGMWQGKQELEERNDEEFEFAKKKFIEALSDKEAFIKRIENVIEKMEEN